MKKELMYVAMAAVVAFSSCKDDKDDNNSNDIVDEGSKTVTIRDTDSKGIGTRTLYADTTYILDGLVFVNDGQVLTIEAGTVIKGKPGQEEDASALVVARGAQIFAEGTAEKPIIFTAEADNLNGNIGLDQRGLWGGLIVLGSAKLNSNPGETAIEGIPTKEKRGMYGGNNDVDNSGVIKYVSIRHGGTDIGEGNEINGLTLGGVGSGTTIDYVEVIANKDDGIEFFGGTASVKHAIVSYCGDDSYDYDEGFRGKGQFWVAIQDANEGDRIGEHDGGTDPETAQPYAIPTIYNATYIGRGADAGKRVITFRDNAGGHYINCIFANQAKGIDFEILIGEQHSYKQMQDGNLTVENSVFSDVKTGNANFEISFSGDSTVTVDGKEEKIASVALQAKISEATPTAQAKFTEWNNTSAQSIVTATNPIPSSGADAGIAATDNWFESVTYQGAFAPNGTNWAQGWTRLFE